MPIRWIDIVSAAPNINQHQVHYLPLLVKRNTVTSNNIRLIVEHATPVLLSLVTREGSNFVKFKISPNFNRSCKMRWIILLINTQKLTLMRVKFILTLFGKIQLEQKNTMSRMNKKKKVNTKIRVNNTEIIKSHKINWKIKWHANNFIKSTCDKDNVLITI